FSLLAKGDGDERRKLDLARKEWGFFQITNHGVADEVLHKMKSAVAAFFALPLEEKKKYAMAENDLHGCGQGCVVSEQQKLDWCDMMALMTLPPESRNFKFWPLTLPGFKYVEVYSTEVQKILSNGMYRSIEHRAITNEKKERISVSAFAFVDDELEIGPLDSMVEDLNRPRMYQKIKYVDYIGQVSARKMGGKAQTDLVKLQSQ
ncbi:hypothetical protein QUC31_006640, partial [Theobroma cacao]